MTRQNKFCKGEKGFYDTNLHKNKNNLSVLDTINQVHKHFPVNGHTRTTLANSIFIAISNQ